MQAEPERLKAIAAPMPARGSVVEITEGPMRGLVGEVQEHRNEYRLLVRITSIRMAVRVHVPATWIQPV